VTLLRRSVAVELDSYSVEPCKERFLTERNEIAQFS
jgi:hypothetical protein